MILDLTYYPLSGQTTVSDALENALKRINLTTEWSAVLQLYYQDHDGVFCRLTKPDSIPDKNELFLKLFMFSPVLLEILLEDKSFRKVSPSVLDRSNCKTDCITRL